MNGRGPERTSERLPKPDALSRNVLLALAAVVAASLALRLGHLFALRTDLLFDQPPLDEERYLALARQLARGAGFPREPHWQPPGVVYALAALLRLFGDSLLWVRVAQAAVGSATVGLTFLLARRALPPWSALAAAALVALHGPSLYATSELLPEVWIALVNALALWALLRTAEQQVQPRRWAWAGGAGALLGLSAVFKPVILPFAGLALLWLLRPAGRRLPLAVAFLVGLLLPLAPPALHNARTGAPSALVSTNGGLNLFLGNNERYRETLTTRPGRHWQELVDLEPARAGATTPAQKSRHFLGKALTFAAQHPLKAAGLLLRKLYLFFNGWELARDTDLYAARERSPVLAALVFDTGLPLPSGLLMPLAVLGLALTWRDKRLRLLLFFALAQAAVTALFFVASRYRVPSFPAFAVFAVAGARALSRSQSAPRVWALRWVALAALVGALCVRPWEAEVSFASELSLYRGLAAQKADTAAAVAHFRRAAELDPADPRPWFELGNALAKLGQGDAAVDAWSRAAAADPWELRPRRRAAFLRFQEGKWPQARALLKANLDAGQREPAQYAYEYFSLAQLDLREGNTPAALAALSEAARRDPAFWRSNVAELIRSEGPQAPRDPAFWRGLAGVLSNSGEERLAVEAARRASNTPALSP